MKNLLARLQGYQVWLPTTWRVIVVIDRDDEDCVELKTKLESIAREAGLATKTSAASSNWQVVNRLAIEELEAWFLGGMDAVRSVFSRVPSTIERRTRYRDADGVRGGTWEALERILQRAGYYTKKRCSPTWNSAR
ncbi:MAG: DUF4276 family protein [Planctomycetota bacterium]|nr:DUF4276 family protein [Planctomycetota bacterium]